VLRRRIGSVAAAALLAATVGAVVGSRAAPAPASVPPPCDDPTQTLPAKVNTELVTVAQANRDQLEIVREFIENHVEYTSSKVANTILGDWDRESRHFFAVVPKTDVAKIEARKDGLGREDEAEALVAAGAESDR